MAMTGAKAIAKLQSNCHHQQSNTQSFTRLDALVVAKPTVSKHWRETGNWCYCSKFGFLYNRPIFHKITPGWSGTESLTNSEADRWNYLSKYDTSTKLGTNIPWGLLFRLDALALSVIATATWVAGWLSVTAGIVSKRLNVSENFFDHLIAPS